MPIPICFPEILLAFNEAESYHWSPLFAQEQLFMQTPDVTDNGAHFIAATLAKLGAHDQPALTDAEVQVRSKKYGQRRWWRNSKTRSPR